MASTALTTAEPATLVVSATPLLLEELEVPSELEAERQFRGSADRVCNPGPAPRTSRVSAATQQCATLVERAVLGRKASEPVGPVRQPGEMAAAAVTRMDSKSLTFVPPAVVESEPAMAAVDSDTPM